MRIERVTEADLADLLPLVRAYCDFYEVAPSDDSLRLLSLALIDDPVHEGIQLLARSSGGDAIGFATVYWTWNTLLAERVGVMHDLFVAEGARGCGVGEALIHACRAECRRRRAVELTWQTARGNRPAQALYDRVGAERDEWIDYSLPAGTADGEE